VFERAIGSSGPMTRQELRRALAHAGIDAAGGRLGHLVMHAELLGVLCSGPRQGSAQTYALVDERVPASASKPRDEALAELARRFVAGHGPAQDVDLAWWSGLSLTDARRGLSDASPRLEREVVTGRTFWSAPGASAASAPGAGMVHLLPNYDELLVAFRDRSDALHPALPPPARVAQEILNHVIVRDGLVVGRWRRSGGPNQVTVGLDPLVGLDSDDRRHLAAAVDRFATFLGRPVAATGLD
jgi:hypothetical protein